MKREVDIKKLIEKLTLEEKASLCSGEDFWRTKAIERMDIPSILLTDGPHGVRKQDGKTDHLGLNKSVPATCFPTAVGLASSWNRSLISQVGMALGKESQAEGVSILLGPGANIKRSPLCGRNFEYYSEDPYLTGELAAAHINGVQSQGVGTSLKHFAVNNQEHRRMTTNAIVDERTLREIYLNGFEIAVKKSQPWTVMSAYNKVNGKFCSENKYLLTEILKNEWGHEGIVVSDWGAVNEASKSVNAGMELEMPSSNGAGKQRILEAIKKGALSEKTLDDSVGRLLKIIFKAVDSRTEMTYDVDTHHQLAREAASESMVLLKNDDQILPLALDKKIAIIGDMAEHVRYQGGGSSRINPTRLDSPLQEIINLVGNHGKVTFSRGYDVMKDVAVNKTLIEDGMNTAKDSDVTVIFVGLPDRFESEGYDREHLNIPENQLELIEEITIVQPNTIVILSNGAPIEMPWIHQVKGVVEAYLGGQATGGAISDLLFGIKNPSGKLAETFPVKLKDNPSYLFFPGEGDCVKYQESIFAGYRYYDAKGVTPLFPFGHGLSYTNFEYSNLSIDRKKLTDKDEVIVSVTVANTGLYFGKEIVQLYVRDTESSVSRPEKELKGFEKIALKPGEKKDVTFKLDKRSFAYYNTEIADWYIESGEFEILIGKSSRDIVLKDTVNVKSTVNFSQKIHRNTTLGDLMENPRTVVFLQQLQGVMGTQFEVSSSDPASDEMWDAMIKYMPLRATVAFSQGNMNEEMLTQLINQFNEAFKVPYD